MNAISEASQVSVPTGGDGVYVPRRR